jgi:hypothetical protein
LSMLIARANGRPRQEPNGDGVGIEAPGNL